MEANTLFITEVLIQLATLYWPHSIEFLIYYESRIQT